MIRPLALLFALLAGLPARGASVLEAAQQGAGSAREKVTEVRGRQMSLRQELNQLASRIETLKAAQKGALLPGSELERSLQRSQELSGLLTETARELSQAESASQQQSVALLGALNGSLDELKSRWDKAGRDERRILLDRMHALRAQREQVRATLPAAAVPALEAAQSDDPAELLEQADAYRDAEDKVRQRMQQLQARIRELRDERDLDRRMSDFLGEEAMFDEQDRRLRLSREQDSLQSGGTSGRTSLDNSGPAPQAMSPTGGGAAPAPGTGGTTNNFGGPNTNAPPPQSTSSFSSARAADARPAVDGVAKGGVESDDLKTLESQLKALGTSADQLEQKAKDMERRAK